MPCQQLRLRLRLFGNLLAGNVRGRTLARCCFHRAWLVGGGGTLSSAWLLPAPASHGVGKGLSGVEVTPFYILPAERTLLAGAVQPSSKIAHRLAVLCPSMDEDHLMLQPCAWLYHCATVNNTWIPWDAGAVVLSWAWWCPTTKTTKCIWVNHVRCNGY